MKTRTAIALLIGAALATPAEAQTVRAKTFVRERILLGFSRFSDQGEIEGYLSMMDLSGIGSHIDIFLRDAVTKEPIYDCAQDAPGQRDDLPPQDFNIRTFCQYSTPVRQQAGSGTRCPTSRARACATG